MVNNFSNLVFFLLQGAVPGGDDEGKAASGGHQALTLGHGRGSESGWILVIFSDPTNMFEF